MAVDPIASADGPAWRPPFGPLATILLAVVAFGLGQAAAAVAVSAGLGQEGLGRLALPADATVVVWAVLAANLVQTAVLLALVMGRAPPACYLGLDRPGRGSLVFGAACLVALVIAANVLTLALGRDLVPPVQIAVWRSAADQGMVLPLLIALVIVAPIGEELLFRGFLFAGCARTPRSARITIAATAAVFAALHVQYDAFGIALIFAIGVLFGWLRWRSGSTTLTVLLHIGLNAEGLIETMLVA